MALANGRESHGLTAVVAAGTLCFLSATPAQGFTTATTRLDTILSSAPSLDLRAPKLTAHEPQEASTAVASSSFGKAAALAACGATLATVGVRRARRSKPQQGFCDSTPALVRHNFPFPFMSTPSKKTVIITGASSGLGLSAAQALAATGEWYVIMACRDFSKAEVAAKNAKMPEDSYEIMHCDLASKKSVRSFVRSFRALNRPLDALVCNAAVYFPNAHKPGVILPGLFPGGGPRWSPDGHELSFAANYLGHFLLVNLMMDDLKNSSVKPARCVILGTVTATVNDKELGGMIPPLANLGKLEGLQQGMKAPITMIDGGEFNGAKAYKDSKVCDVIMMKELHKRFHNSTGIVFSSLYPGCIAETQLFREHYPVFQGLFPVFQKNVTRAYVSQEEAGKRLAACVADPRYNQSGAYYSWEGDAGTGGMGGRDATENTEKDLDWFMNYGSFRTLNVEDIGGEAADEERCRQLWDLSEKLAELR